MTIPRLSKGGFSPRKANLSDMGEGKQQHLAQLVRALEGRQVSIALTDGSRIDDCQLVSGVRHDRATLWLYDNGEDRFVALIDVRDVWEAGLAHPPHAA